MNGLDGWDLVGRFWHGPNGERLPAIGGGQNPDPFWLDLDVGDATLGGIPLWELGETTDWLNTQDWSRGVFDTSIPDDFLADAKLASATLANYGLTREDIPFLTGTMGSDLSGPAGFDPAGLERGGESILGQLFVDEQNRVVDESGQVIVEASGLAEIERGIEAITARPGDPTAWQRVTAALKPVNDALKTPVGGILATLGLGGLGLALGSAVSGGGGTFTPPAQQLTPGQQLVNRLLTENPQLSGVLSQALTTSLGAQQTVAQVLGEQAERELAAGRDQASVEADIRARALQGMQDYLAAGPVDPRTIAGQDPLTGQIRDLVTRQAVSGGAEADPLVQGLRHSVADVLGGRTAIAELVDPGYYTNPVTGERFSNPQEVAAAGYTAVGGATGRQTADALTDAMRARALTLAGQDPRQDPVVQQLTARLGQLAPGPDADATVQAMEARLGQLVQQGADPALVRSLSERLNLLARGGEAQPGTEDLARLVSGAISGTAEQNPMLDRLERQEMDQLLSEFARRGPQYGESSAGIEKLVALKQAQSERRFAENRATITQLDPVLQARRGAAQQELQQTEALLERVRLLPFAEQQAQTAPLLARRQQLMNELGQTQTALTAQTLLPGQQLQSVAPLLAQRERQPLERLSTYLPLLQARETLPNLQLTSLANILGGREANALSIANLFSNQAEQRRAGAQALASTGRATPATLQLPLASIASIPSITGVSDLTRGTAEMNQLNQYLGLQSFLAGERARTGLGSSIAALFGDAASTGFKLAGA